jgi:hypothetical protein
VSASFEDVLADVAERLQTVQGLAETYAGDQDSIVPPCAVVAPAHGDFIQFDPDMSDDSCDYLLDVTLYVPAADAAAGQAALYPLLRPSGSTSVRAAIGRYSSVLKVSYRAAQASNMRSVKFDSADGRYLACDILVRVTV